MGLLGDFHKKISSSLGGKEQEVFEQPNIDHLIALGVLLSIVADADDQFLPHESNEIERILKEVHLVTEEEMPVVIESIRQAHKVSIDMYSFVQDASSHLEREGKIEIVESLFRVACADQDLDNKELEMIRKLSGLLRLDHKEFIAAKVKVKKEFNMDTAGL